MLCCRRGSGSSKQKGSSSKGTFSLEAPPQGEEVDGQNKKRKKAGKKKSKAAGRYSRKSVDGDIEDASRSMEQLLQEQHQQLENEAQQQLEKERQQQEEVERQLEKERQQQLEKERQQLEKEQQEKQQKKATVVKSTPVSEAKTVVGVKVKKASPAPPATKTTDQSLKVPLALKARHGSDSSSSSSSKADTVVEVALRSNMQQQQTPSGGNSAKRSVSKVDSVSRSWVKQREPHEHQHGYSVFQSDENELTIVDSDYSDFEDEEERPHGRLSAAKRSVVVLGRPAQELRSSAGAAAAADNQTAAAERLSVFLMANEDDEEASFFGWQTLPSDSAAAAAASVAAVTAPVQEEEIAISVSLSEQQMAQTQQQQRDEFAANESLLELDQALAVFEVLGDPGTPGGVRLGGKDNAGFVIEEHIRQEQKTA